MTTTEIERNAVLAFKAVSKHQPQGCGWCDDEDKCDDFFDEMEDFPAPEGFTTLGAGGSRVALLKDDFVYKVEYVPAMGRKYRYSRTKTTVNADEIENYYKIQELELPSSWKVPVTDVVFVNDQPVIVMEYINGDLDSDEFEYTDDHKEFMRLTGLGDIYMTNVVVAGGFNYAIDFAQ